LSINNIGTLGLLTGILFLFILIVGFFYEWKKGVLNWSFKISQNIE
jgi:NADH-quinone oxidoreductase subunit A